MAINLTPRLCRASRAMAGWQQTDLAERSEVSRSTIAAFEQRDEESRLSKMNNRAVVEAFEQAGLHFIEQNGGGAGVRLRKPVT